MKPKRSADGYYELNDGRRLPSVTSVLNLLMPEARFGIGAAERGTEVHDVIHHLLEGYKIEEIDPQVEPFVQAWQQFADDTGFMPEAVEQFVICDRYGYAGTLDAVGVMTKAKARFAKSAVFDWKTCTVFKVRRTAGPQLAAYEYAYRKTWQLSRPLLRFVVLLRADGAYRIERMHSRSDFTVFLSCLNLYRAFEVEEEANDGISFV